jgi:DGQHR domain-containing protein
MNEQTAEEARTLPPDPDRIDLQFPALRVTQPIGDLYLASMSFETLSKVAYFDVRRVLQEERDVERYLGIQRPLNPSRVKELEKYVNFKDATFPTAIIIAVPDDYASFDVDAGRMTLRNYKEGDNQPSINIRACARVIDGQHRIAGLFKFTGQTFDLPVSVFVGSDISDQAYVFATVNLEQNKVSRSLAYDLFELAKTRSPQRTCHQIAVTLDNDAESPLFKRIKRLGFATPRRVGELLTQAAFVEALIRYISVRPKEDRDMLLRGQRLEKVERKELERLPFRNLFIDARDVDIARIIFNYFSAVQQRWPEGWANRERGIILNKTSGFKALMRLLGPLYWEVALPGNVPSTELFLEKFRLVPVEHVYFTIDRYPPGGGGEGLLYRDFSNWMGIDED